MNVPDEASGWARLRLAFDEAVALDAAGRAAVLDRIGAADTALRVELEALLAADASATDRLERVDRVFGASERVGADPLALVGRTVGHFQVIALVATGGMGVVYRAFDTKLERAVALKFPLPHHRPDARVVERFRREARAAAALDHPAICNVYEAGETDDAQLFLAMALYDGETLQARLTREGSLPHPAALDIAARVAGGLAAAHRVGIVHRDLKPANVMLLPDGGVKILDFGLARMTDVAVTTSRGTPGTIGYMAPELIRGDPGDARSDLWALGVLLYEMLAGERPFEHRHEIALTHAILNNEPVRPSALRHGVDPGVERLVLTLLAKDAGDRPDSAELVAAALDQVSPRPASEVETRMPRRQRHPRVAFLVTIAVALPLLGLGAWLVGQASPTDPQPRIVVVLPMPYDNSGIGAADLGAAFADAAANRLSRLHSVAVPGEVSVRAHTGSDASVERIAADLGAAGVVRIATEWRAADVRIEADMYDARRRRSSSHSYVAAHTDLHVALTRILDDIATGLRLRLESDERALLAAPLTASPEAWELYLRGRAIQLENAPLSIAQVTSESLQQAHSYFALARELDGDFALARAQLAQLHLEIAQKYDTTSNRREQGRLEAEAALRLDPELPEAHSALVVYYRMGNDPALADQQLRRAIAAAPHRADLRLLFAFRLRDLGQWEEAAAEIETALRLDPLNPRLLMQAALTYSRMRRYRDAIAAYDRLIPLQPDNVLAQLIRGHVYQRLGTIDTLAVTVDRIPPEWDDNGLITWSRYVVLRAQRRHADALVMLDSARHPISFDDLLYRPVVLLRALTLDELGETARARSAYEAARVLLEDSVAARPRDARIRIALGLAYAGLGRRDDAVREARAAMDMWPLTNSSLGATAFMGGAVEVFLKNGNHDEAIRLIELLLAMPAGREASVPLLRMEPMYDPLRSDPRFEQLLVRFSRP